MIGFGLVAGLEVFDPLAVLYDIFALGGSGFLSDGSSFELPLHKHDVGVAKTFDATVVQAAIKEAQQNVAGYTYKGFCEKVMQAGCAGYIVSFLGKRVLYYGRTAETHVELFPQS